jgi:hypothetical protein
MANYVGDVDEIWKVQGDANKRLKDYHNFENTFQKIKGQATTLVLRVNSGEEFKNLIPEISIINQWIDEYNSESRQYDREMWKSDSLPKQLKRVSDLETLKELSQ